MCTYRARLSRSRYLITLVHLTDNKCGTDGMHIWLAVLDEGSKLGYNSRTWNVHPLTGKRAPGPECALTGALSRGGKLRRYGGERSGGGLQEFWRNEGKVS